MSPIAPCSIHVEDLYIIESTHHPLKRATQAEYIHTHAIYLLYKTNIHYTALQLYFTTVVQFNVLRCLIAAYQVYSLETMGPRRPRRPQVDSGYAWVILASSVLLQFMGGLATFGSIGALFVEISLRFPQVTATEVSLFASIQVFTVGIGGQYQYNTYSSYIDIYMYRYTCTCK